MVKAPSRYRSPLQVETLEDRLVPSGDMVIQWNNILRDTVRIGGTPAPAVSRIFAITQAAIYDSVNALARTHDVYLVDTLAHPEASREAGARPPVTTARPELTADGTGERFRHLVNDLLTVAVRMDAVRARFAGLVGVTPPQYTILVTVAQLEGALGGATVRGVADHMHVSGAFVTAETGKLAAKGLIAKRPNPADGRSVLVTLTRKGRKALDAALPHIRAVNDVFFGKLGADCERAASHCRRDTRRLGRIRRLRAGRGRNGESCDAGHDENRAGDGRVHWASSRRNCRHCWERRTSAANRATATSLHTSPASCALSIDGLPGSAPAPPAG